MNKKVYMLAGLAIGAAAFPPPAHAYFLPLLGAGGVIATALAGFAAMVFSAVFLAVYKIHRALKRWRGKREADDSETPAGEA